MHWSLKHVESNVNFKNYFIFAWHKVQLNESYDSVQRHNTRRLH